MPPPGCRNVVRRLSNAGCRKKGDAEYQWMYHRADVMSESVEGQLFGPAPATGSVRALEITVTEWPAAASVTAAASPLGPEPTTTASA